MSPPRSRKPSQSPPKKPTQHRKKSKNNNKQEQLKKILDQVQSLKQEYVPEREQHAELTLHSKESRSSSYYDLKGSFDLVNQSKTEKVNNSFAAGAHYESRDNRNAYPVYEYGQDEILQRSGSVVEFDRSYQASIFDQDRGYMHRSITPLNEFNDRKQMNQTVPEDQLQSYRCSSQSGDAMQATSQFQPSFANTHNPTMQSKSKSKRTTKKSSLKKLKARRSSRKSAGHRHTVT